MKHRDSERTEGGQISGHSANVGLSLEQRMLLQSLQSAGVPMSVAELERLWRPSWSLEDIERLLKALLAQGWLTRVPTRTVERYRAGSAQRQASDAVCTGGAS